MEPDLKQLLCRLFLAILSRGVVAVMTTLFYCFYFFILLLLVHSIISEDVRLLLLNKLPYIVIYEFSIIFQSTFDPLFGY